ncbi:MAG: acyl-CoA-binding protein [Planctomycetes bacterium]|nr:acyl-CoA-binding protein [Planctomycetota bacterium]
MASEQEFKDAADRVKGLTTRPSNDQLLSLYSLYKQATSGDASGKRPGAFKMKDRAKFDAWTKIKGKSNDAARDEYVALVQRLEGK